MAAQRPQNTLAPPAVVALKEEAGRDGHRGRAFQMERTVSENIREERDDLKKAAEQSMNAIMDLDLDGTIRWMSPSWHQLTNAAPESVIGKSVSEIICDHKSIFADALEAMRIDDSKSRIIRFTVSYNDLEEDEPTDTSPMQCEKSAQRSSDSRQDQQSTESEEDKHKDHVGLEAQGIMVYDRSTGEESHVSVIPPRFFTYRTNYRRRCG